LERLRALGADFAAGQPRRVMAVRVPWKNLRAVAALPFVEEIGTTWRPATLPALDLSNPEVDASDGAWLENDDGGFPLLGDGVRVADMDTGVDVFHPALFHADGGDFPWLDVNTNGAFDPGTDRVDLTAIGKGTPLLNYAEGSISGWVSGGPVNPAGFQADWDWLYADLDGDAARDTGGSYGDADPGMGEPAFLVNDANQNGSLDVGETLALLSTPKVLATYNAGGVTRRRGVDLSQSTPDTLAGGHGTAVAGILAGQTGARRLPGLAPNADLLVADIYSTSEMAGLQWAEAEGADVVLHEFGAFLWEYLDGSSAYEQEMDAQSAKGIWQITPSGNLSNSNKHCRFMSSSLGVDSNVAGNSKASALYASWLWEDAATAQQLGVTVPGGANNPSLPLAASWSVTTVGAYDVWTRLDVSSRGTVRVDVYAERSDFTPDLSGTWTFRFTRAAGADLYVYGYVSDDVSGWGGGTVFANYTGNYRTVTHPATADTAITCGSYATRAHFSGTVGDISGFSGRGPRMGGASVMSVAAPGHNDVYTVRSKDASGSAWGRYLRFGGTSAATPHLAAGAALLRQYIPLLPWDEARDAFRAGAFKDGFTGPSYNNTWGEGKLRIWQALAEADRTPPAWDSTTGLQSAAGDPCAPLISLAWNSAADVYKNPVLYNIYRDTVSGFTPGPGNLLDVTASLSYGDAGVASGVTYYYVVRARDSAVEPNEDNNLIELSASADDEPAASPVGNTLEASLSGTDVLLSWSAVPGAADYAVYGGTDPAALSPLGVAAGPSFTHAPPAIPVYFYRAVSRNACGEESP
jgi:subtilisin family serine protease